MTIEEGSFEFSPTQIAVAPTDRTHYIIHRRDWRRLRRDLDSCDVSGINTYANAGWAAIGIVAGATVGLISLYATESDKAPLPLWAKVLLWVLGVAGLVIAVALLLLGKDKASANRKMVTQVAVAMQEIEDDFSRTQESHGKIATDTAKSNA